MGIEYEFLTPNPSNREEEAKNFIKQYNISYVNKLETEHDNMMEIVTKKMPVATGFKHIKQFFESAKAFGITFPNTAGIHISISHKRYNKKDINLVKFLVLISGDYLHSLFPERSYVKNITDKIRNVLQLSHYSSINDIEKSILNFFTAGEDRNIKYITTKISDYFDQDGRIELRFFGGKNYDKQYDEIRWQTLRALYILSIAYEHDMFRKEYLKTLYSLTNPKPLPDDYDLSNTSPSDALELLMTYRDDGRLTDIIATSAEYSVEYARHVIKGRFEDGEDAIITSHDSSFVYAMAVIGGRFEKGESIISTDARSSYNYALDILEGRFEKGEDAIANSVDFSLNYAIRVLKGRFEKGEDIIATSAEHSFEYALEVLKGRFEKGEDIIATSPEYSFLYATEVLKGRFEKGEAVMYDKLSFNKEQKYKKLTGIQL